MYVCGSHLSRARQGEGVAAPTKAHAPAVAWPNIRGTDPSNSRTAELPSLLAPFSPSLCHYGGARVSRWGPIRCGAGRLNLRRASARDGASTSEALRGGLELQGDLNGAMAAGGAPLGRGDVGAGGGDEGGDRASGNETTAADGDARELAVIQQVVDGDSGIPAEEGPGFLDAIELAGLHEWHPTDQRLPGYRAGRGCS
jgi:hypothetical protein